MQLRAADHADFLALIKWFDSQAAVTTWAGPGFHFPFDEPRFLQDLKLEQVASYVLVATDGQLLGFGQYSAQHGHCHLSRLAIHPLFRGHGLIQILIGQLARQGKAALGLNSVSLFVQRHNQAANKAYQRAGFVPKAHPQGQLAAEYHYMVQAAPL